ncbi:MAG: hypothetical protein A3F68_01945 [Acidobacteria bacterium RIFCSPLOWO2_12_FULL_54_10]|nr:MAG: hypothetical protein A3F68_01945 [Acidobacteria bacterium RIFCSPLOWO2_12_FULL_54_10]
MEWRVSNVRRRLAKEVPMRMRNSYFIVLTLIACSLPAWSQLTTTDLKAGEAITIEGTISDLQLTPGQGPPFLQVKTSDGTMYTVHFGPIMALRRKGFEPALNNNVVVSGEFCCVVNGRQVIRSNRIVLEGKTFITQIPPGDLSMLPPGSGSAPGGPMNMQGGAACANMPGGCPMMQQGGGMNMPGGGMGMGMNMPGGQTGAAQGGCCAQGTGMMMGPGSGMNMQQGGSAPACANMPGGCPMMQQGGGMGMGQGMNMQQGGTGQGGGMNMNMPGGQACPNMPEGCPMTQKTEEPAK